MQLIKRIFEKILLIIFNFYNIMNNQKTVGFFI